MIIKPSQGEIWLVDLDPLVGHEQAKRRPCLIVSNDTFNHGRAKLSWIIPLTSQDHGITWHVEIAPSEGGLKKISYIMCEQLKSFSHLRFGKKPLGIVNQDTMDAVKLRIRMLADL